MVNKKEVKTYQVVYDKRIIIDKGENTIPFGYYWIPSTTTNQTSALPKPVPVQTVPDHEPYSLAQPQPADQNVNDTPSDIVHNGEDFDIDLMETDEESGESDFKSENEEDEQFLNDTLSDEDDVSFYRRLLNH